MAWYNLVRPHERLRSATPEEIHTGAAQRFAPSVARTAVAGLALRVRYLEGRRHLPIVALERAA